MNNEKILDIADKYDSGDKYGAAATWNFITEDLIAFARDIQKAERERIKQIVNEVAWQGNHDKWFDCADAIMERIEDVKQ